MSASPASLGFQHRALFYSDWSEYVAGTVPFIRDGLASGEEVLVAVPVEKIALLRSALDQDADRVTFANMAEVGANPALIIPLWQQFLERHPGAVRGIGEPIWPGRSDDELRESQRHEALLNVAFGNGRPWSLLCPYDTRLLSNQVIDVAFQTHEYFEHRGKAPKSTWYRGLEDCTRLDTQPFSEPSAAVSHGEFESGSLWILRRNLADIARLAGMQNSRVDAFVFAVNEVATNSVVHGGGSGRYRTWVEDSNIVCEIRDLGRIVDPLVDRTRPREDADGPRGLWVANQLCDLVQIHSSAEETVVRLRMGLENKPRLSILESSEEKKFKDSDLN